MSSPSALAQSALQAFDDLVQASGELRDRPGQRQMAEQVARVFSQAGLGKAQEDEAEPARAVAVIQAGTGVGKSLAYCAPAVALALARNTRVLIATATVALQEQLVHKDLPALAAQMPQPFRHALAKGRGRYVCKLKLARLAGQAEAEADEDLFADEEAEAGGPPPARQDSEAQRQAYAAMARELAGGAWDGDRDSLADPPEAELWRPVSAEASSCTGKHCPAFANCTYYDKRKELVGAQVIVANHDLLLSSLGSRLLPELDNCLLVLDEGHHLPATALDQFACQMDLSRSHWVEQLARRTLRIGGLVAVSEVADVPRLAAQLRQTLLDLSRLVMDLYGSALKEAPRGGGPARARLPRGELPAALDEPLRLLSVTAESFLACVSAVAKALRAEIRDKPGEARRLSTLYAQIGMLAPRLEAVHATAQLLLQEAGPGEVPAAKWFSCEVDGEFIVVKAHASPILPGATLRHQLWSAVRGAVVTSATLTSCGRFDFFLREAGLHGDPAVATLEVASPFDYAAQGRFIAAETLADPKDAAGFNAEMAQALVRDLAAVRRGALVLFTSREQMRVAVQALPAALRETVLVQTELPRAVLLRRHRERVEAGGPSVIFGMQSFGEGLDLPGALCESLFIAKLPFAPPDDPVGEARAEWLRGAGRDPFSELVVPATAIRLAQWAGRAIRTETDRAEVTCYDRRLTRTAYGQRLLQGLPPFTRLRRDAEGRPLGVSQEVAAQA
ncbi:ATP-dependent DNA helicase DinG [Ramlibacter sp. 2FC]|uniref:ATP-dependent DNA helicase DinG n=1 Tax=Ramlibacter sp. 2FC TaxID=2502188 RepID=UPI0010F799F1|nr:ATP-dependent DNA helicase DinG [Ramlibacter sp. 2FC]